MGQAKQRKTSSSLKYGVLPDGYASVTPLTVRYGETPHHPGVIPAEALASYALHEIGALLRSNGMLAPDRVPHTEPLFERTGDDLTVSFRALFDVEGQRLNIAINRTFTPVEREHALEVWDALFAAT